MLTTIAAIAGLVFGASSLVISILNYRRDRSGISVALEWGSVWVIDDEGKQARFSRIYITNAGRRPVYITAAGIEFDAPRAAFFKRTEIQGKVKGRKLAEGDPPLAMVVAGSAAELIRKNRDHWRHIRAFALDSTGKLYRSPVLKKCPPWGEGDGRIPYNFLPFAERIECDLEQHQLESYLISGEWVLLSPEDQEELKEASRKTGIRVSFEAEPSEGRRVTFIEKTKWPACPPP